ncbi:ATP-dependent metallopeptidase Hfl [Eremomyces bilateralis CBS 781.70]|uniref:ATP-dependent metallopeptidase Hfl n=1 Tax=Eremomyces bilateralis CBS 781.70 TaxID=1392243 RepID=A0A6G1FV41_9PEZI|nr:ATP-dependent metallopeptidase Hfl [Eremomyces bilateralis CBS 781.70]KAF1809687.1 ATP-dependent metallopeptidase Hfl [Eremomyces bilateralis CBS 781.70]
MALQANLLAASAFSAGVEALPSLLTILSTPWRTSGQRPTTNSRPRTRIVQKQDTRGLHSERQLGHDAVTKHASEGVTVPLPEFLTQPNIAALKTVPTGLSPLTWQSLVSAVPRNRFHLTNPQVRNLSSVRRNHSTSTTFGPFGLRKVGGYGNVFEQQRRGLFGGSNNNSNSSSVLSHLEQTANNNPQSATAQNAFYSACLRANRPDIVAHRYQTGRFAANPACEALYTRSLERLGAAELGPGEVAGRDAAGNGGALSQEQLQAVGQAVAGRVRAAGGTVSARGGSGAKTSPLHVVVDESMWSTVFKLFRFLLTFGFGVWITMVVLNLLLEGTGMLRRVSGQQHAEARPELQTTRFSDVHGCEEAKDELLELVEFLKSPDKFSALGGKLPKGVLLVGPPGTGKTLLARAVAGEAGVPFFYMSGSEFDEVYVGVGAKRVRELFTAARTKAPAIVFIDELDAIGGKRNERDAAYVKQTLNQLLTELDGFDQDAGVIIIGATNFPESLDKALTRPGRFDRHVVVPLPDVRGRLGILTHHMRNVQISTDVDASVLARATPGFSGAELENVVNQAAVHASKRKAKQVAMIDFEWAKDKVLMGAERRSAVIQQKDKIMTAYHEGGHALVAMFTAAADPLYKATIMPRGHALGITYQLPEMDRVSMAKKEYLATIDVCMGGKVAEELVYGNDNVTSGASSDLQKATSIAYAMVTQMGMSDAFGNIDLHSEYNRLSSETRQKIWDEVHKILEDGKDRATKLLLAKRKELDLLADALVEYEYLDKDEMEKVVRGEKLPGKMKMGENAPIKLPDIVVPGFGGPKPPQPVGGDGGAPPPPPPVVAQAGSS